MNEIPMAGDRHTTHRRVQGLFNLLAQVILRSPLHGMMSYRLLLITFTGRKSGKVFMTPISYVQQGETLLLGVGGPWWKNLRGGATVQVLLRGKRRVGVTEVLTEEAGMAEAYRRILAHNPMQGRFTQIRANADGHPNPEDIRRAIARGAVVVKVHLKA
jgi:deazaflavin-dependent oxidoreductase (nitroreductase family)